MDHLRSRSYFGRIFCLFILFMISSLNSSVAQINIKLTSMYSTCENNGILTVEVFNASPPFSYAISSSNGFNSVSTSNEEQFIWTSLFPGVYTVTVSNGDSSSVDIIEVLGDYVQPNLELITLQEISCPGGSDGIISATAQGGRGDYEFDLYKGTISTSLEFLASNVNDGVFPALDAGHYTVFLIDSCANQVAQSIFLFANTKILNLNILDPPKISCDSVIFNIENGAFGGTLPFQYRILEPPELATSFSAGGIFEFDFIPTGNILFEVIDACGNSRTDFGQVLEPGIIAVGDNSTCDDFDLFFTTIGIVGVSEFLVIDGLDTVYSGIEPILTDVSYNTLYQVFATGTCGEKVQSVFVRDTFFEIISAIVNPDNCQLSGSTVSLVMNETAISNIEFELLNYPLEYEGDTVFNSDESQQIYGLFSTNGVQFIEGSYRISLNDGCGRKDTFEFDIDSSQILNVALATQVTPLCGDLSSISYQLSDNSLGTVPKTISLYESVTNELVLGPNNGDSGSFEDLPVGDYYLEYTRCEAFTNRKNISLDTTPYPIINTANIINCESNDSLTILVSGGLGVPQYEYRLFDGPENGINYPIPWQVNPLLGKFPNGSSYKVQLKDACETIVSYDVSELVNLEPEFTIDSTKCGVDTIIIAIIDPIENIEYFWTLPNDSIVLSTFVEYPSTESSGIFQIDIDILACTSLSFIYDWNGECNIQLPVEWLYFDAEFAHKNVKLEWGTSTEINNSHFEIMKSKDGISYFIIGRIQGAGNSILTNNYTFNDDDVEEGFNYYKIKQVDFNGHYNYSEVKVINNKLRSEVIIFPNPASDNLEIQLSDNESFRSHMGIYSMGGDLLFKAIADHSNNQFDIDCVNWPRGMYILHVYNGKMSTYSKFLLK